nr:LysR substrate-binding domain-containing protein [Aurantimonas aggregata]
MPPIRRSPCGDLSALPTITYPKAADQDLWEYYDPDGAPTRIRHERRIICNEFAVTREAAVEGLGGAMLPEAICLDAFAADGLERVLPKHHAGDSAMYLLSPRGAACCPP